MRKLIKRMFSVVFIILFISLSFSSAISVESKVKNKNEQKRYEYNIQKSFNVQKFELNRLLFRLDFYVKVLEIFSINNLKYMKLRDEFKFDFTDFQKNTLDSSICDVLESIYLNLKDFIFNLKDIYNELLQENPTKAFIFNIIAIPFAEIWLGIYILGQELSCWNEPF